MATTAAVDGKRGFFGTLRDIYHERTKFDFIGRSKIWGALSLSAVVISLAALGLSGLNLGIDFEGGTQWQFSVQSGSASAGDVRDVLKKVGVTDTKVLILGDKGVRVQSPQRKGSQQAAVTKALAQYAHTPAGDISVSDVGPTWGGRVSQKALIALGVFFALIAAYLTFRFEWEMALSAIIAVVHDIIITVGVYAITGFEVTPATVVAFLTILGFSLYDTVVVFDKIRENEPSIGTERADNYSRMVNRSMNQVLMRSINTSFVALLPVASLLVVGSGILGAVTLRDFALALFVGLMVGAYSSIFVATPILAWLKERQPRYRAVRERSAAQAARDERVSVPAAAPQPVGARAVAPGVAEPAAPSPTSPSPTSPSPASPSPVEPSAPAAPPAPRPGPAAAGTGGIAPRPRQQRRRKRR
jgi:preprotein translocase subunit SecF